MNTKILKDKKSKAAPATPIWGRLVSRLNNPEVLTYDGEETVIPPKGPRGKIRVDRNLLGPIPKGLRFIPE